MLRQARRYMMGFAMLNPSYGMGLRLS